MVFAMIERWMRDFDVFRIFLEAPQVARALVASFITELSSAKYNYIKTNTSILHATIRHVYPDTPRALLSRERLLFANMSSHEALSAASNDRKSRLAQLKSLKRKQAPTDEEPSTSEDSSSTAIVPTESAEPVTKSYLSGRNYDPETRNVKLGFESAPVGDQTATLEYKAEQLALESKAQQAVEETEDKPLDLFKLQPKKPNWDLKRDLEAKMKPLNVLTDNAIARIVRERIEGQKNARSVKQGGEGEEVGMEGSELVEALHLKEREEEAERKRDEEDDVS